MAHRLEAATLGAPQEEPTGAGRRQEAGAPVLRREDHALGRAHLGREQGQHDDRVHARVEVQGRRLERPPTPGLEPGFLAHLPAGGGVRGLAATTPARDRLPDAGERLAARSLERQELNPPAVTPEDVNLDLVGL